MKFTKINLSRLCLLGVLFMMGNMLWGQQSICFGEIKNYSVDIDENAGNGTTGSSYIWEVITAGFDGTITPITSSGNQITIDWGNTPIGTYTLRVTEEAEGCVSSQSIEVNIDELTFPEIANQYLCPEGGGSVTFTAPSGYDSYSWENDNGDMVSTEMNLTTSIPGVYELIVTQGGCEGSTMVEAILVEYPTIDIQIINDNTLVVNTFGGNTGVSYQLEDVNGLVIRSWQSSNTFYNVPSGEYRIALRTNNGECITTEEVNFLIIPNTITPNGDGINDLWEVKGLEIYENASITIMDRYGKQLAYLTAADNFTWDGKYLKSPLPTTSYWYIIDLGNGKTITGWILVKNRN